MVGGQLHGNKNGIRLIVSLLSFNWNVTVGYPGMSKLLILSWGIFYTIEIHCIIRIWKLALLVD